MSNLLTIEQARQQAAEMNKKRSGLERETADWIYALCLAASNMGRKKVRFWEMLAKAQAKAEKTYRNSRGIVQNNFNTV